jgi:hypothetical protein
MTKTAEQALQRAIKIRHGYILTLSRQQFYSERLDKILDTIDICLNVPKYTIDTMGRKQKTQRKIKLFTASNKRQAALFLRDVLYYLDGKEIPTDSDFWEDAKAKKRTYRIEVDKIYQEEAER